MHLLFYRNLMCLMIVINMKPTVAHFRLCWIVSPKYNVHILYIFIYTMLVIYWANCRVRYISTVNNIKIYTVDIYRKCHLHYLSEISNTTKFLISFSSTITKIQANYAVISRSTNNDEQNGKCERITKNNNHFIIVSNREKILLLIREILY